MCPFQSDQTICRSLLPPPVPQCERIASVMVVESFVQADFRRLLMLFDLPHLRRQSRPSRPAFPRRWVGGRVYVPAYQDRVMFPQSTRWKFGLPRQCGTAVQLKFPPLPVMTQRGFFLHDTSSSHAKDRNPSVASSLSLPSLLLTTFGTIASKPHCVHELHRFGNFARLLSLLHGGIVRLAHFEPLSHFRLCQPFSQTHCTQRFYLCCHVFVIQDNIK